jgi:hypothetical protein
MQFKSEITAQWRKLHSGIEFSSRSEILPLRDLGGMGILDQLLMEQSSSIQDL